MYLRFLLLLLAWLCVAAQPMAQTRKRVGLVLSGGGAKGIAHIGVLKVLEENGIPIDYIAGASMGSVMGGMYAAGYTAQQLDSIVRLPQFQRWVLGELPPGEEYLFGKREQGAEWFNFQVRVDSNYQVETGSQLVKDTSLNFALMKYLYRAGAKARYDFDSLPIPFRATASDVLMRQSVTLRKGDLFESVRASMAVPLVYRPMLIDRKYLYDGGVYDNLPIDVMRRDFKPDVMVVVNLGKGDLIKEYPYAKAKAMLQGTGVLRYLIMDSKAPSGLSDPDVVYLQVPVNDFSPADFHPVDTLVRLGEETAREQLWEIKAKVGALVAPGREDRLQELYDPTVREIVEIDFEGALTNHQQRYLRNILKPADGPVSIDELLERYNLLISQDYFRDVFCKLIYDPERKGYRLLLSSNPNKQVVASVGGNFSSRAISQLYLGVNFNLLSSFLFSVNGNLYTGPFYTSPHLNLRMLLPGKHLDFFSLGYTFNRWDYSKAQELLANTDKGGVQVYRTDRQVVARLGRYVGKRSVLSVFTGGWWERLTYNRAFDLQVDSAKVQAVIDASDYLNTWVVGAAYTKATLNAVQFPTSGMRLHASVKYLLGNEGLDISEQGSFLNRHHHLLMAKVSWEQYWGRKWVAGVKLEGVASNMRNFLTYTANFMYAPAYYPLIDSRTVVTPTFRSPIYTAFTGILDRQVFFPSLRLRLQGVGFVRYQSLHPPRQGIVLDRYRTDVQMDWAASLSAIYHSPLGPVSFSALRYSDKQLGWGVLLNVGLMLYNPRIVEE